MQIQWKRKYLGGYEVSSRGDKRFSALFATLAGRTIEQWYQCDVKAYQPGGRTWRLGKGKPPALPYSDNQLWFSYLTLWRLWAVQNPDDIHELWDHATNHQGVLTDMFANSDINQARALATILNEWVAKEEGTSFKL